MSWTLSSLPTKSGRYKAGVSGPNGRICDVSIYNEADMANARLIAAAPDMLAALRRILNAPAFAYDDLEDEDRDACDAVRAAIAKAEGGTP